ncbi:MAG: alpha/beta hydrolase [Chloroflexi bacterium]|nr:alpha/beta hydrolase [Chloroflexota bacterium]
MPQVQVQLFPYLFQPNSGPPIAAEWGQLFVPENRQEDNSRLITIPFVRFRCTSKDPGTPIVFLQGGPGESLLPDLSELWTRPVWRPPLEIADFVFIEQRGFGLSRPCLDCPGTLDVSLDEPGSTERYLDAQRSHLTRAVSFWQEQGIDLGGYNVREMAADIDDLRQALGYERISLFGGSFGSHHGLTLLRYYGQFIERALLWGVEGPNHTLKLPSSVQRHLVKLDTLLKKDSDLGRHVPDLLELMTSVLDRLERQPVTVETLHPQTKNQVHITLGKYDLQLATANGMGNTFFLQALPARYLTMAQGDYTWLAEQVIQERVDQKSNIMYAATDCASGATAARREQIAREAPTTLLGDTINEPFHALCDMLGNHDLGDDFRSQFTSDVPTCLVCGSLDARTPISNAQELLPDLSNGQTLTIKGVSHDLTRGDHVKELTRCRDEFFRSEPLVNTQLHSSFAFQPYEKAH